MLNAKLNMSCVEVCGGAWCVLSSALGPGSALSHARGPLAADGAWAGTESRLQAPTVVLCGVQDRGGEVRHILPALDGTQAAEGREAGQAIPDGDPVHLTEEPLSSLPAIQRACALPQQHLPGMNASNRKVSKCFHVLLTTNDCLVLLYAMFRLLRNLT